MQYRHAFTVVGSLFPIDMMRYDRCTPATEEDSTKLGNAIGTFGQPPEFGKIRMVAVNDSRKWEPTHRRWSSFGMAIVCQFGGASKDGTARGMVTMPEGFPGFDVSDYPETTKL